MNLHLYQVDSFTNEPFKGNPAGVCILEKPVPEKWMQQIAMEMNLAETAFIYPIDNAYHLRWFTPLSEVELCGHATLATAHVLFESGRLKPDQIAHFQTLSGKLSVNKDKDLLEMNFPATPAKYCEVSNSLFTALQISNPVWTGRNSYDYLIEIDSEENLRNLHPDFSALKTMIKRGVIVTAKSDNLNYDFISRFFAPVVGIDEDPVTGSAHCTLGPHWKEKLNKSTFNAYQASRRGGSIQVEVVDNRILLRGKAITVFKIQLNQNLVP